MHPQGSKHRLKCGNRFWQRGDVTEDTLSADMREVLERFDFDNTIACGCCDGIRASGGA